MDRGQQALPRTLRSVGKPDHESAGSGTHVELQGLLDFALSLVCHSLKYVQSDVGQPAESVGPQVSVLVGSWVESDSTNRDTFINHLSCCGLQTASLPRAVSALPKCE
eukprot:5312301-Pyramimonas_sp.AAC.1